MTITKMRYQGDALVFEAADDFRRATVTVSLTDLQRMMRRAAGNKTKRSTAGPVTVTKVTPR